MSTTLENYPSYNAKLQQDPMEKTKNEKNKVGILKKLFSLKGLIIVVFIIQLILLGLLLTVSADPISNLIQKYQYNQIVVKVADQIKINASQAQVIAIVGDVDKLRSANSIQAEVYKDAMNGDYIVGVLPNNDTIVIYRKSESKVIYKGDSPQAKLTKLQVDAVGQISAKAKEKKLLDPLSTEVPSLTQVIDPGEYTKINSEFYKNIQKDDIIAYYPKSQVVLIYRISNNTLINSGKLS